MTVNQSGFFIMERKSTGRAGNIKNQKEVPEYVKVYFEYNNSEHGMKIFLNENGIGLSLVKEVNGKNVTTSGYKEWDWVGNLIYEASEEE